jgi:hypothetical protein
MSGRDPVHLSDAYRAALDKAKANPAADISAGGLPLQGGMLLQTIKKEKDGADNAFLCWARAIAREARLSTQSGNIAPAVEAKPIIVVDTPDYKQTVYRMGADGMSHRLLLPIRDVRSLRCEWQQGAPKQAIE